MKTIDFRRWLHEIWLRNCDERADYHEFPFSEQEYVAQYKYWLKQEYRRQKQQVSKH